MRKSVLMIVPVLALAPLHKAVAPGPATEPVPAAASVTATTPAPATAPEGTRLQSDLEKLIESPNWRGDRWSVLVVSLDKGDTLFAHDADAAVAPASNLKLFTDAAALYYLGGQYRYNTFLLSDAKIENGVVNGDLIVYGTGDPTFSARFGRRDAIWHAFADTLKAAGITEVRGNIIGDASYFEGPANGSGWQDNYMNASYAAPASALTYAENIASLQIKPGIAPGMRPEVTLTDGAEGITVLNEAQTVARGRSFISVARTAYDGPIVVRGQIRMGNGALQRTVPVADPAQYAAAVFRQILISRGINVTGQPKSVTRQQDSPVTGRAVFAPALDSKSPIHVIAIHQSPPLFDILDIMMKKSHNLMAEQSIRTVGRMAEGEGSASAGYKAVQALWQRETGHEPQLLTMDDGSGLSVLNRVSAHTVIELLAFMSKTTAYDDFYATLPEAGVPGGLHRMFGTKAQGNLKAKTGTIDNVSALSGYVRSANGEHLAFSIISNNVPSTWRAKRVEDAIGARLAAWDRNNDTAQLTPADFGIYPKPKVKHRRTTRKRARR